MGTSMARQAASGVILPAAIRAMLPSSATPVRSSARPGISPKIIPKYTNPKINKTVASISISLARQGAFG